MEIEFRDYTIRPGCMSAWLTGWRAHILPLREHAGFRVCGAWVDSDHGRFIWVLSYDGIDGFDAADDRYHESRGRVALDPEPSDLIKLARKVRVASAL